MSASDIPAISEAAVRIVAAAFVAIRLQATGGMVLGELLEIAPDAYLKMLKEYRNE